MYICTLEYYIRNGKIWLTVFKVLYISTSVVIVQYAQIVFAEILERLIQRHELHRKTEHENGQNR